MTRKISILLMCLLLILSCSDKGTKSDIEYTKISGITETDNRANIISLDSDDWLCSDSINDSVWICTDSIIISGNDWTCSDSVYAINPSYAKIIPSQYCLGPAYPNPTSRTATFIFTLPKSSSILIWAKNDFGYVDDTLFTGSYEAGRHSIEWDMTLLDSGLYRLYMEVDNWQTYGDIKLIK